MPAAPPIILTAFSGEQPRILPRLMPENAAQSARDCRLDDGGLTPMRQPEIITDTGVPLTWKTIYNYLGVWIGWDTVVNVAQGPVAQDRLYYTGDGVPKMRIGSDIYNLAVARPTAPLTLTPSGSGSGDIQTRLYAYTFVTALGEESEPSPISLGYDWKPGITITLSGFQAAPGGSGARFPYLQRIYRTQTGSAGTTLYLIAERIASAGTFVDNIAVNAIAEPCPSISYNAPRDDLEGLISLPNGIMAAFGGADVPGGPKKKLFFSEQYRPHAWPEKYALTIDTEIMGLGAMNLSTLVATAGQPYFVSGTLPENMTSQKVEQNLPCVNKRTMVDLGYAIAYASNEGIVVARADGSMGIASAAIFNRDGWQELNPQTMIAAQINGRYVAFYDYYKTVDVRERGALLLDLANPNFLIRSDVYARAAVYDVGDSALYYAPLDVAEIRRFDSPYTMRKRLYWKSKEFVLPYPENYGAIIIDTLDDFTPLDQQAEDEAEEERQQTNEDLIVARDPTTLELLSLEGDIASTPIGYGELSARPPTNLPEFFGVWPVGGDKLLPMPRRSGGTLSAGPLSAPPLVAQALQSTSGTLTVGVFADGVLIAGIGTANRAVRLPSGFRARTWELDVFTDQRIDRITMAKTMDDLKRTG